MQHFFTLGYSALVVVFTTLAVKAVILQEWLGVLVSVVFLILTIRRLAQWIARGGLVSMDEKTFLQTFAEVNDIPTENERNPPQ